MTNELPEEILLDIFLRLPAKSVGKCRCLSKPWKSLLSSPEFIKSHLNKSPQQEALILISSSSWIHSISPNLNTSRTLQLGDDWALLTGSVNGLVLLLRDVKEDEYSWELFLANPTTLQQVKIPDSPLALKGESVEMHGFGYDSCSDDYKIVRLSIYITDPVDTFVDVYSVKMAVWRRVGTSPYDHSKSDVFSGGFVNGCVHWLADSRVLNLGYPSVIVAFELAREVFDEVPAPDGVYQDFVCVELTVLGGCLCMLAGKSSGELDVWILKEYGLSDSWMKFSIDDGCAPMDMYLVIRPLCFVGNENDVVLVIDDEDEDEYKLAVYNREKETFSDMVFDVRSMIGGTGTYVESLVSPTIG